MNDILKGNPPVLAIAEEQELSDTEPALAVEVETDPERPSHPFRVSIHWVGNDTEGFEDVDESEVVSFWLNKNGVKNLITALNKQVLAMEGLPKRNGKKKQ